MQPHERVVLQPVAANSVSPVHQRDPHLRRVVDEGVGEAHPHRAGADHEVVDIHPSDHSPAPSVIPSARSTCETSSVAGAEPSDSMVLADARAEITTLWPVPVTARC